MRRRLPLKTIGILCWFVAACSFLDAVFNDRFDWALLALIVGGVGAVLVFVIKPKVDNLQDKLEHRR